ncbi:MAG: AAC(3) family N-acetyltransferase [Lachnospiraceae bacterium]|nr:AAC(3) family N-acetyltransferase [Lachnospiraceae bacterium]
MVSKDNIKMGLVKLGVEPGMILEVHSSLSSFGYVDGGAITVIDAIKEVVTEAVNKKYPPGEWFSGVEI